MNNQFNRTISSKLATIAILGCSFSSSLVFGQQLTPIPAGPAPALPPIVRASDLPQASGKQLPPVVPVAHAVLPEETQVELEPAEKMPPITTPVQTTPTPIDPAVLGKNFPENATDQIAEFIRTNGNINLDIDNSIHATATKPEANQPSTLFPLANESMQQDVAPGDLPVNQTPEPSLPASGQFTPFEFQTESGSETQAAVQGDPVLPLQANLESGSPMPMQYANEPSNYFEPPYANNVNPQYNESTWSPPTMDYGYGDDAFACCGFVCDSTGYIIADGLSWNREDGIFRAGNFTTFNDYDWTGGGRITFGKRRDCTRGWEATYAEVVPWQVVNRQQNAAGLLNGWVFPSTAGLPSSAFTAFRNSTFLQQFQKSDFINAEINKTYWGVDVAKAFIGARFIYMDDEFRLDSTNIFGQTGFHHLEFENNMFGVHFGGELLYDIGYRFSFSVSGKLGGYANFYQGLTQHVNDNTTHVNISVSDTEFSGSAEAGIYGRLKLGPRSRLRLGYEAMGLYNIYEAESNFNPFVSGSSGSSLHDGGAFYQGFVFGLECYR